MRYLSFGEFEKILESEESDLEDVRYLFTLFHPHTRPVLWRILAVQAHLYYALMGAQELRGQEVEGEIRLLSSIPKEDRARFDWRKETDNVSDEKALNEPFEAAERYLRKELGSLLFSDAEEISDPDISGGDIKE